MVQTSGVLYYWILQRDEMLRRSHGENGRKLEQMSDADKRCLPIELGLARTGGKTCLLAAESWRRLENKRSGRTRRAIRTKIPFFKLLKVER